MILPRPMKKIYLPVLLICFLCSTGCSDPGFESTYDSVIRQQDDHTANLIDQRESRDVSELISLAEHLLDLTPLSVTTKPIQSSVSNPRTYVSLACYWWPDPNSEEGTPYIRRDGEVNPETRSGQSDLPKLIEMAKRVELLSSAFQISGEEIYAEKAVEQLIVWFINKETAMFPHLEHAQRVKGKSPGRSYGVIDTWWLVRVIESIPSLRTSVYWSDEIEQGLRAWFTHYLNWLRNSEFGQVEMQSKNNHGTWYDLQVVTFARFVGQNDFAIHHLEEVTRSRIPGQITLSGRQKYETRRPRPLHYSIYNLSGLMKLAIHGRDLEIDLSNNHRFLSGTLEDALLYLVKRMEGMDPKSLSDEFDQTDTDNLYFDLLRDGLQLFPRPEFKSELTRLTIH